MQDTLHCQRKQDTVQRDCDACHAGEAPTGRTQRGGGQQCLDGAGQHRGRDPPGAEQCDRQQQGEGSCQWRDAGHAVRMSANT